MDERLIIVSANQNGRFQFRELDGEDAYFFSAGLAARGRSLISGGNM